VRRIVTGLVAATGALRARSREREGRVADADLRPLDVNSMSKGGNMTKYTLIKGALAAVAVALLLAPAGAAHNRAHIILPDGTCMIVGSVKSVELPENAAAPTNSLGQRDLRPGLPDDADEIGTSFAADQGSSRLQKGPCP
jgi:hypothetical protein